MRKILSLILALAMILPVSGVALASGSDPVTLDIAKGSIEITAAGYKQAATADALAAATPTDFTGDYVITGTYELDGTVSAESNQIKISAGTEAINVTLQDLTVKHHDKINSNQQVGGMLSPLQVLAGTVNLKLEGTTTLIADGKQTGFYIKNGAEAVISGTGNLTSLGGFYGAGIGASGTSAAGSLTINSGTIIAEGGQSAAGIGTGYGYTMASITINGGTVVAKGGAQASGIGASWKTAMESVTINGGHVTATGGSNSCGIGEAREKVGQQGKLSTLTITGGTIVCSGTNDASAFKANTTSITGGNFICDPYPTVTDRSIAEINFAGADENTLVSIKEGDAKAWSAYCDENGIVNAYLLDNDKVSFTASVGGEAKTVYKFATGKFTVGAECSCAPTTFDWADTADTAKVYNKEVTVPVTVDVNKCDMAFHKIGDVTWTLDSVKVGEETVTDASAYATADTTAGTVTLKPAATNYAVVLKAALEGYTGDELAKATKEIKVTADKDAYEINIGNGPVTVEAGTTTGTFTYKQNGSALYENVPASAKVVITGEYYYSTGSINAIYIKDCSPTIVFENVTLSDAGGKLGNPYLSTILIEGTDDIEDHATLLISGVNSVIRKTNISNAREYCGIEIRNAELTIDCIDDATCNGETCPHKLIVKSTLGDQKGAVIGSRASEGSAGFSLNIAGGQIEVSTSGGRGTAIGTGMNATASNEVNIKIEDAYVKAVANGEGTAIGVGKDNSVSARVSVTIEGGKVDAVSGSGNICRNNITLSGGATINGTTLPEDMGTTTIPAGMVDEVKKDDETGAVTLPAGTSVKNEDGAYTVLLDKGSVDSEGNLDSETPTATVKTPDGKPAVGNADGTFTIPAGSTVNGAEIPATAGTVTLPTDKLDEVKADAAGNVTLPAGTVIENADGTTTTLPNGGTIGADGTVTSDGAVITENTDGSVTVTEGDAVTTITPPTGEDVTVNPDGTVEVPAGSTVNGTVLPDTGDVILPADKVDEVKPGTTEGTVVLPESTVIENADGTTILPNGGTIGADGTVTSDGAVITEKTDGSVTITDKDKNVTTITPPEGEDVVVNADGTVEVPAGSTVTKPDGTTITLPNGGTIGADGTITPNAHKIIEGANGIFNGKAEGLTFKSDADNENFESVKVDGNVVGATNYERTSGSTVITLKAAYLKTLTVGEHTLEIVSNTGTAATKFTIAQGAGVPVYTGGSSYSGPSIWYIGGNTFGTSTTKMPTAVEIDNMPVPFSMEGSKIVVSCINPGAKWITVRWNSTSATIRFNPDVIVSCPKMAIPKTGDMPIWAAIAEFLGF